MNYPSHNLLEQFQKKNQFDQKPSESTIEVKAEEVK